MAQATGKKDQPQDKAGYAAGAFFLFWAAVGWAGLYVNAPLLATLDQAGLDPGPALLPLFTAIALTLGGLWFLVSGLLRNYSGAAMVSIAGFALPGGFFATALLTAFWIVQSGFALPTFVFGALWLFLLTPFMAQAWKRVALALIISGAIVAAVHLVFVALLRVPLP